MPLPSGIISVDTLQAVPAAGAFTSGELLLEEFTPSQQDMFLPDSLSFAEGVVAGTSVPDPGLDIWAHSTLNLSLMALGSVLVVLYMRKFVTVFPYLADGLLRWKPLSELEHNMRLARERDALVLPSFFLICVFLSRLSVFRPEFIEGMGPGLWTAATSGVCAAFLLVRRVMMVTVPHRKFHRSALAAANGAGRDFLILGSAVLMMMVIFASVSYWCLTLSRILTYYAAGFLWMVYLVRKTQILSADAGHLQAILYLCTVEILPAALLVVSMLIL